MGVCGRMNCTVTFISLLLRKYSRSNVTYSSRSRLPVIVLIIMIKRRVSDVGKKSVLIFIRMSGGDIRCNPIPFKHHPKSTRRHASQFSRPLWQVRPISGVWFPARLHPKTNKEKHHKYLKSDRFQLISGKDGNACGIKCEEINLFPRHFSHSSAINNGALSSCKAISATSSTTVLSISLSLLIYPLGSS